MSLVSWIKLPQVSSSIVMMEPVVGVTGFVNVTPFAANRSCSACTSFTRKLAAGWFLPRSTCYQQADTQTLAVMAEERKVHEEHIARAMDG